MKTMKTMRTVKKTRFLVLLILFMIFWLFPQNNKIDAGMDKLSSNCPTCPKNPLPRAGTMTCDSKDEQGDTKCTYQIPIPYESQYLDRDDEKGADSHVIYVWNVNDFSKALAEIRGNQSSNTSLTFDLKDYLEKSDFCTKNPGVTLSATFSYHLHYPSSCNIETRYATQAFGSSSCEIFCTDPAYPTNPDGGCCNNNYWGCMVAPNGGCCAWPSDYLKDKVEKDWSLGDWGPEVFMKRSCPPVTHKECVAGICKDEIGAGLDQCTNNSQCQHYECTGPAVCSLFMDSRPNLADACSLAHASADCPAGDCFSSSIYREDTLFDSGGGGVCYLNSYKLSNSSIGQFVTGTSSGGNSQVQTGHVYKDETPPTCDIKLYPHAIDKMQFVIDWGKNADSGDSDSGVRWYEVEKCVKRRGLEDPGYYQDEDVCGSSAEDINPSCRLCVDTATTSDTNCCESDDCQPGECDTSENEDSDFWKVVYEKCAPLSSSPNSIIESFPQTTFAVSELDETKSYYVRMRILDKAGNWSRPNLGGTLTSSDQFCGKIDENSVCEGTGKYSPWCGDQLNFGTPWFQVTDGHIHSNSTILSSPVSPQNVMVSDSSDTNYSYEGTDKRGGFVSSAGGISYGSGRAASERGSSEGWMARNYGVIHPLNSDSYSYGWFMENYSENIKELSHSSPAELLNALANSSCQNKTNCRFLYNNNLVLGNIMQDIKDRSRQAVIFVNGDLTIDQNFVPQESFPAECDEEGENCDVNGTKYLNLFTPSLMFIVKGEIKVDPEVTNIYGFFFSDLGFHDGWNVLANEEEPEYSEALRNKLWIFGALGSAGKIQFKRESVAHNLLRPSEQVVAVPKYFFELSSDDLLGIHNYIWGE